MSISDVPVSTLQPGRRKPKASKSTKAGLRFTIGGASYLKTELYAKRIGSRSPLHVSPLPEYLAAQVLELAGNASRDNRMIIPRHIPLAESDGDELSKQMGSLTVPNGDGKGKIGSVSQEF